MNALLASLGIPLPHGARLVEASSFQTTTIQPGDTHVDRIVLDFSGCQVQVLRYDKGRTCMVFVAGRGAMIDLDCVGDHIAKEVMRRK